VEKESVTERGNPAEEVRIERYRGSRYWGVWLGEKLLAVTVYKRGAQSVAELARESGAAKLEARK
jgi:hypothetical protein